MEARVKMERRTLNWRRWCAAAACLGGICITAAAFSFYGLQKTESEQMEEVPQVELSFREAMTPPQMDALWKETVPSESGSTGTAFGKEVQPIDISSLLVADNTDAIQEMQLQIMKIPVGKYEGIYEKVYKASADMLEESTGDPVPGTEGCFLVAGHEDMQYLVQKGQEGYSLWKFQCFAENEYPYRDVLELVYRLDGAEDITEIRVEPAKMDNTEEGKRIQEEIGTHIIKDSESIEMIYETLASMTCYGSGHWERIDYGAEDAPSDGAGMSHRAVRLGRYLTLTLVYGNEIDGLKYTAVSDMFYEFSGIAYSPLEAEQAREVRKVLGIDLQQKTSPMLP